MDVPLIVLVWVRNYRYCATYYDGGAWPKDFDFREK